jgi:branched-chain amino acid transport system permease protein
MNKHLFEGSSARVKIGLLILLAVGLAGLGSFPVLVRSPFLLRTATLIFLYSTLGQAWNILAGYAGQISLGHAAFFGAGAYTSSFLLIKFGITPWIGIPLGILVAVLLSVLIGYPCFRLRGHYYAIATLVISLGINVIVTNTWVLGGATGLFLPILEEGWSNLMFHTNRAPYYYIALFLMALVFFVARLIEKSALGYYFRAIREDEDAAKSLGVYPTKYKLIAGAISAAFTSLAGSFYAYYVLYIDPNSVLGIDLSIKICMVVILGGIGKIWGPLIGTALLIPLSEGTRIWLGGTGRAIDLIVYGLFIMIIAILEPAGLLGIISRLSTRKNRNASP